MFRRCIPSLIVAVLLLAAPAVHSASLIVAEDTYTQGDTVSVTFLNDGLVQIWTVTGPPLGIQNLETEDWVLRFGNLPESVLLDPGESLHFTHDTGGDDPDPSGTYRAYIQYGVQGEDGTVNATADYSLLPAVEVLLLGWGEMKVQF